MVECFSNKSNNLIMVGGDLKEPWTLIRRFTRWTGPALPVSITIISDQTSLAECKLSASGKGWLVATSLRTWQLIPGQKVLIVMCCRPLKAHIFAVTKIYKSALKCFKECLPWSSSLIGWLFPVSSVEILEPPLRKVIDAHVDFAQTLNISLIDSNIIKCLQYVKDIQRLRLIRLFPQVLSLSRWPLQAPTWAEPQGPAQVSQRSDATAMAEAIASEFDVFEVFWSHKSKSRQKSSNTFIHIRTPQLPSHAIVYVFVWISWLSSWPLIGISARLTGCNDGIH